MYRKKDKFGEYRGGPMYYIEMGLGENAKTPAMKTFAKTLAVVFAILGASASVGAGNMFQANQVAQIFVNLFQNTIEGGIKDNTKFAIQMTVGVVLCVCAALVMLGGIKRIGNVASKLVPSMCIVYVLGSLYIIVTNITEVPGVFALIFESAFSKSAATGAFFGVAVRTAVIQGVRRACFSNEAGLGSAPIAHATAKTSEPIREGVVASVGPFIDTIVICTMTALVIIITGALTRASVGSIVATATVMEVQGEKGTSLEREITIQITDELAAKVDERLFVHTPPEIEGAPAGKVKFSVKSVGDGQLVAAIKYAADEAGRARAEADDAHLVVDKEVFLFRDGVNLTAYAFDRGLAGFGTYFIPIAALLFAFSTIVSWGFYGETCTEYLFGERAVMPFKVVYVLMILVGTYSMELKPVLDWSDGMLGLMLVPNLIGTILLAPLVMRETKKYFQRLKNGEFDDEVRRAAEAKKRMTEEN
ncbi:MAG: alanine:cation symporter family protein, partial [Planctomycetes bacterium]|nr:alanine:cation symporter family protein [Planctomycetota bacterium]